MKTNSFLVQPAIANGKNRRIELSGLDLWTFVSVNNVFVYPSEINVEKFKEALSETLSSWPLVSGIGVTEENDRYFIEMIDRSIPVMFVENDELDRWPLDSNVIVGMNNNPLTEFFDPVQTAKNFDNVSNEALIRFKITHLVKSSEWILGSSWSHALGDAASVFHFLTDLSRTYQKLEISKPLPVFERILWPKEDADPSFHDIIKQHRDAKAPEEVFKLFAVDSPQFSMVNFHFSGDQLTRLRSLVDDQKVSTQDVLVSYLISSLNRFCFKSNNERIILRTNMTVNFRSVSDSIAAPGAVSNAVMMMLSEDFDNPYSISSIAKTIRKSIERSRDEKFLRVYLATTDDLFRTNLKKGLFPDLGLFKNEVTVNSNHRYDWASDVDFGQTDRCRFYTSWAGPLYFRVFRQNPTKINDEWAPRDRQGAQVVFQIDAELKQILVDGIQNDFRENFINVQI